MSPETRRLVTYAYLRRLAMSKQPIIMGPWRSEVGFECLYWLPFLRWAVKVYGIDPKRLITVTRGGASMLYGTQSVDLYRLRSVDAVRLENQYDWQRANVQKQMQSTQWDRDVIREAAAHVLGRGESYLTLHPSWMYWVLEPFWNEERGMAYLSSMTDYAPITGIKAVQQELPAQYVAMKWYSRPTLEMHDETVQQTIAEIVGIVGAQTPIVLLQGTPDCDDHADLQVTHPSIVHVPPAQADKNLGQQIQILAKAQAFIGTYGGMAQLALRLGVPSLSLYKEFGSTAHAHLSLSSAISKRTKVPFLVGSVEDAQAWRKTLSIPVIKSEAA